MIMKSWKLIAKIVVMVLQTIAVFASDKPTQTRYSAINAQHLHDEGLISDAEYAKSVYRGK
ncbi:hypothetical protein Lsan_2897 [Legionella santicrucis]|uniref:SHOCT domain-containing protein n=1 Tax=Legionella santicrucis TaxID=45074 RepID=A0A0W0YIF5_9GAMM|nr:hypothetical protein [Legionella santicrucis]KTD56737.1 hypothetical protein Lsan_2897 [Legionella santicrucis]